MSQHESIGSNNKNRGLPDEINQDTKTEVKVNEPIEQAPVKPVFTDDKGDLQSKDSNAANGYNEKKQTEPGSDSPPDSEILSDSTSPSEQPTNTKKVYGKGTEPFTAGKPADQLPDDPIDLHKQ